MEAISKLKKEKPGIKVCAIIADLPDMSSLSSKKSILQKLFEKHLAAGRRVQFGELGSFRYGVGSAGVATAEEFDVSMIRTPKIVFSPGSSLRRAKRNTVFEKYVAPAEKPATPDSGGEEEEERPGGL